MPRYEHYMYESDFKRNTEGVHRERCQLCYARGRTNIKPAILTTEMAFKLALVKIKPIIIKRNLLIVENWRALFVY